MSFKFMRIILFFDLPSKTKLEIREYTKFVKHVKQDGFMMFQESVYTKLCINQNVANSVMKDIKKVVPPRGFISCLIITETQFSSIENILGDLKTDVINSEDKIIKL